MDALEEAMENDPDFWDDPDEDDESVKCWACYSCGKIESKRPSWGGQCPRCGSIMEEETL